MTKKQKKRLYRIIASSILLVVLYFAPITGFLQLTLYLAVYLIIGYDILRKAGYGILNGRVFDENFLMSVATIGAFALAIYEKSGDYNEAIAVMLFYQIGEWFESYAVGRSRKNISELMDIRPDYANVEQAGKLLRVAPDEVALGSQIIVQPGEKIPLDGKVLKGSSTLNTSALTGESLPRDVQSGDEVVSGCINLTGVLTIQTTKNFGESTVSKILELVENASSNKAKSENFISRFARIYTPIVCFSALALAVLPPLFRILVLGLTPGWEIWVYRALVFLVISCPCALVISVPLSFFAGIGGASKSGILIKGANYLEGLAQTKYLVFDKTGTLTQGVFEVSGVHYPKLAKDELIEYAALAESSSTHPISKSLQKAYGKKIDRRRVKDIKEISGQGVVATVDGKKIACGNEKLMKNLKTDYQPCHSSGTIVHIVIDDNYVGHIVISDQLKPTTKEALGTLKVNGVKKTIMLTGDNNLVAKKIAAEVAIDEYHSNLLPADKVTEVEELLSKKSEKEQLAFVGDGINDAPVLTRADIGIAMGALGSDAAIEAADVVLMDDDPLQITKAIKIARKCMRIVYQNISFALIVKFICLILGAVGIANMWLAIFADVGVMIIAVLNAIRALNVKQL